MSVFQNLSNALDETFAATLRSEDELSYASATLILAGLLQIHAQTPRYASHRARLESFTNNLYTKPIKQNVSVNPSASEFASAGFFHTGSGDETICPACGLGLRDWQASDQPEACHVAYSTAGFEMNSLGQCGNRLINPVLPCLYLAVRRLLVSELPLARKSLVPAGPVQSVLSLPGVISRPVATFSEGSDLDSLTQYPSLADRLRAIIQIMSAPPAPQGWPVTNARALGHSDDLIVLALWRLQVEAAGMSLACPPTKSLLLDPHATTDVLRAILRVQEGFDPSFDDEIGINIESEKEDSDLLSGSSDAEATAEDAETAALSRCRCQRRLRRPQSNNNQSSPCSVNSGELQAKKVHLPRFYQFLVWWSNRWPSDDCSFTSKSQNII